MIEQYGRCARAADRFSEAEGALAADRAEHFGVVLAAIAAGQAEPLRPHRAGEIHGAILHALEQESDL